jgi:multiple sugar transport system permease protein
MLGDEELELGGVEPRRPRSRPRLRARVPWWMLLPSLGLLALIVYLPSVFALYVSFTDLNQYTIGNWLHAPLVGLHNYLDWVSSPLASSLLNSAKVSIIFSLATTIAITPIGVGAALLLNGRLRGRSLLRAIMLLPYIIPTFVNAVVWRLVFMNGTGLADQVLSDLHLASRQTFWLIGPNSIWALIIADVWSAWPFVYMLSLAALQTIPAELYDAATMDGAGAISRFRHVTLPLMKHTLGLALVLSTINHFNNFTLPFVMFGASPPDQVNVLPLNIYVNSFIDFNFGFGAAMSVVALLIMLIPAVVYLRAARVGDVQQ